MQPNDTESTTIPPAKGPGDQLRQARLALKLAPEDVAQILHLSPRQIIALESDDYAHLPGPTYIRGYLRGYAQLLGLSPEAMVAAYGGLPVAAPRVDLTKLAPEPQLSSDNQGMLVATVGVVALVFGLAVVWWLGREDSTPKAVPVAIGQAPEAVVPSSSPGTETAPTAGNGSVPAPSSGPAPAIPDNAAARAAAAPVVVKPAIPVAAPVPVAAGAPSGTVPAVSVPAGPREKLVLTATAESWADVRDAQQNKLLYETLHPGQTVTVEGRAPIAVFLGNADGVKLEYNGKPFDVTPHKRGVFARFNLAAPPVPAPEAVDGARQQ